MASRTTQSRLLSLAVKAGTSFLQRAKPFHGERLSLALENNVERLLNLPGKLPVYPTRVTDPTDVRKLITKLHPVSAGRELIRLGPEGDGGYLVPDDLEGIKACFSPGVSNVAGFELDCAKRGMPVFMADASVEKPPIEHPKFQFIRKFIGARTEGDFIRLEDWVNQTLKDSREDLLLQMDIEGYEYETLLASPTSFLERFRVIVVEFHDMENLFSAPLFPFYSLAFEKLLTTHACVHIHPNNFCRPITVGDFELLSLAEFTFLRRDRLVNSSHVNKFPHPLDSDNTDKPSFALPRSFYR